MHVVRLELADVCIQRLDGKRVEPGVDLSKLFLPGVCGLLFNYRFNFITL
jgi:hypothetical protein